MTETIGKPSKAAFWAGWVLTILILLFMAMDLSFKFKRPVPPQVQAILDHIGWSADKSPTLGLILGLCTLLYAIPQTSVLGAILLTGYLGGAVATHFRVDDPLFSHILAPVYIGVAIWLSLYLRYPRLRGLTPFKSRD